MNAMLLLGTLALCSHSSSAVDIESAAAAVFGRDALDEVVADEDGHPLSILGRFPGAGRSLLESPDAAAEVASLYEAFGLPRPSLRLVEARPLDSKRDVLTLRQAYRGLEVLDAEITASFLVDGTLESLNGLRAPGPGGPALRPSYEATEVLERLRDEGLIDDANEEWYPKASAYESASGFSLTYGWSSAFGAPVWEYRDDVRTLTVADSLDVLTGALRDLSVTGPCNVRIRDFIRSGPNATFLQESPSTTRTEEVTCEASDFFGTCYWQLRREPGGYQHAVGRVLDDDGGEQEVTQACSAANVPQFTSSLGDHLREQGAFYVLNQMRFFTEQNSWSNVTPGQQANVQITVDQSNTQFPAQFSPFYTDIYCTTTHADGNGCAVDVVAHEYGHYVNWTYGGFSSQCASNNMGYALEETLATIYGLIFILDDDQTIPTYNAPHGAMLGNAPNAHVSGPGALFSLNCFSHTSERISGTVFTQAVWESIWNRNCALDSCTEEMTANGNSIFLGLNREGTLEAVSTAISHANAVLGPEATFNQVRAQMRSRIKADFDTATADRFQRVFSHHGFTCSTCCTGC